MRNRKLSALLQALILSAVAYTAAAQTLVTPTAPVLYPSDDSPSVVVVQPDPSQVIIYNSPSVIAYDPSPVIVYPNPDPAADSKCKFVAASEYWGCVNSYHGGGA